MRERTIEAKLGKEVRALGCLYYKFVSPGNAGVPDRIIVTPRGGVFFVELKREDGEVSRQQAWQIKRLRNHRCRVRVVYGLDDVKHLTTELRKEAGVEVRTSRVSEESNPHDT